MRVRQKGAQSGTTNRVIDYNPDGTVGSDTVFVDPLTVANGSTQTTSDVVTLNFRKRLAAGEVIMNPFEVVKANRTTSETNITFGTHPIWGRRELKGHWARSWAKTPVRPTWFEQRKLDAKARTLLSAHAKIADVDFQALVTVAEARKTASLLARPFAGARGLVSRIASRKLQLVQKGLTLGAAATSAWLEYRFGWKPILFEIQGIKEAYVNNLVTHERPVRLVARAADSNIVWDDPAVVTNTVQPYTTNVCVVSNYSHRAKVSSGVIYDLTDESLTQSTARRMGLRLEDVPGSVWELVPFSFVVDRFLDVGMWLDAIIPKPGVSILGSWTTVIDYQLNYHQVKEASVFIGNVPQTWYRSPGGAYSEEITSISRGVNPQLPPVPTVNYRDLNLEQQIDHLALTIALLTGLKVPKS